MNASKANSKIDATSRRTTLLAAALAVLLLLSAAPVAVADDCCDPVLILWFGETCFLESDCEARYVIIFPGARLYTGSHTLTITEAGGLYIFGSSDGYGPGKLLLDGAGTALLTGGGTSTIDGLLKLKVSGATLEIASNDHALTGDGKIIGQDNAAQIEIDSGLTLTSELSIEGALEIHASSGTFINEGLVNADGTFSDKIVTLFSGMFSGDGQWKASGSGATLHFRAFITVNPLAGDFAVSAGTLDIDESVCTTGNLTFTGGTIAVNAGKSFTAGGSCP